MEIDSLGQKQVDLSGRYCSHLDEIASTGRTVRMVEVMKRSRITSQGEPVIFAGELDLVCKREESKNILISFYDEV